MSFPDDADEFEWAIYDEYYRWSAAIRDRKSLQICSAFNSIAATQISLHICVSTDVANLIAAYADQFHDFAGIITDYANCTVDEHYQDVMFTQVEQKDSLGCDGKIRSYIIRDETALYGESLYICIAFGPMNLPMAIDLDITKCIYEFGASDAIGLISYILNQAGYHFGHHEYTWTVRELLTIEYLRKALNYTKNV